MNDTVKFMGRVTFLCPHKKVTKESGTGEALTNEAYRNMFFSPSFYLGFEPPSPVYPFRPLRVDVMLSSRL